MEPKGNHVEKSSVHRLFLPALVVASISAFLINTLFTLNLSDIAHTFHVAIGTVSQTVAIARFVSFFVGLAMGIFSVRFNHKFLYVFGIVLMALGFLGTYFAANFVSFVFFISVCGAGLPFIAIMSITLVGELLPLEKRGRAAGFLSSALYLALFLGYPMTGIISNAAGWKSVIVWWMLPVALLSLALSFFVLSSNPVQNQPAAKTSYAGAFKQVLSSRSAVACVLAAMFALLSVQVHVFTATFLRNHFLVPLNVVSLIATLGAGLTACGAIVAGFLVNPKRRRPLIVVTLLLAGLGTMSFLFMPTLWSNLAVNLVSGLVGGMAGTALLTLALEQVLNARGTMMSLYNSFGNALGAALGAAIGGFMMNLTGNNYQLLGVTLGAFGVAGAVIVLFLTKDPSKLQLQT